MQSNLWQKCLAEALGIFAIVFFGCGAIILAKLHPELINHSIVCTVWGVVVACAVYTFAPFSGAHFNPAVTVALSVGKLFPWKDVAPYIAAQIVGATLASLVLAYLFPESPTLGQTLPSISAGRAIIWEVIMTFFIMIAVLGVGVEAKSPQFLVGIIVGGVVLIDALIGGPFTGASMNPARSLGPALISGNLQFHWIYWLAPISGAVLAVWIYTGLKTSNVVESSKLSHAI